MRGVEAAELMREYGCDRDVKTPDECVAIEPALAQCRDQLAGGIYTATDESGDAQRFTARARAHGGRARRGDSAGKREIAGGSYRQATRSTSVRTVRDEPLRDR